MTHNVLNRLKMRFKVIIDVLSALGYVGLALHERSEPFTNKETPQIIVLSVSARPYTLFALVPCQRSAATSFDRLQCL